MKRPSSRYVVIFAAVAGLLLVSITALNYLVDPYDVFGRNRLGVYVAADRESRPSFIARYSHDAVLMGTSKAAMIDTTKLGPYRFFSVTFGGASVEELYFFALNYIHDVKLAVIALDFGMFSAKRAMVELDPFSGRSGSYYLPFLLGWDATADSIQTVSRYLRGRPKAFRPDGSYIAEKWAATKDVPNKAALENAFRMEQKGYAEMEFSEQRMDKLKELRDLFNRREIPVIVVLNPLHPRSSELLRHSPMGSIYNSWSQRIRDLFPVVIDLRESKYSTPGSFFAADPVHFKPEVGAAFMNQVVLPQAAVFANETPYRDESRSGPKTFQQGGRDSLKDDK